jgi:hypothetical protein
MISIMYSIVIYIYIYKLYVCVRERERSRIYALFYKYIGLNHNALHNKTYLDRKNPILKLHQSLLVVLLFSLCVGE